MNKHYKVFIDETGYDTVNDKYRNNIIEDYFCLQGFIIEDSVNEQFEKDWIELKKLIWDENETFHAAEVRMYIKEQIALGNEENIAKINNFLIKLRELFDNLKCVAIEIFVDKNKISDQKAIRNKNVYGWPFIALMERVIFELDPKNQALTSTDGCDTATIFIESRDHKPDNRLKNAYNMFLEGKWLDPERSAKHVISRERIEKIIPEPIQFITKDKAMAGIELVDWYIYFYSYLAFDYFKKFHGHPELDWISNTPNNKVLLDFYAEEHKPLIKKFRKSWLLKRYEGYGLVYIPNKKDNYQTLN